MIPTTSNAPAMIAGKVEQRSEGFSLAASCLRKPSARKSSSCLAGTPSTSAREMALANI